MSSISRRSFTLSTMTAPLWAAAAHAETGFSTYLSIVDFGARGDGVTVNTGAIQAAIAHLHERGGGTVLVPAGIFVSGAIFLKPKVDLHFAQDAVLRCSTDMTHFPRRRTRIEGHFEESFTPALINADGCHGLKITGQGTLDGAGRPIWDRFWQMRAAAPNPDSFPNIGLDRARLALIEGSTGVTIEGITFKDSQFWNLHLYRCENVLVHRCRFEVPDDYAQAPSSDGIDLDSCRRVTVDGCYFSVTDDCIAAKGSKGPRAPLDRDSPPVEQIRIRNCHFRRGHQAFTCGSEATVVRDVLVENCRVTGRINLLMLKLRPDTPQRYEDIHIRGITLDNEGGRILLIEPWSQYKDLKGETPPRSRVRNITLNDIRGRFGAFGIVRPNPGQTEIRGILLRNIDVNLSQQPALMMAGATDLRMEQVVVNDRPVTPADVIPPPASKGDRLSG